MGRRTMTQTQKDWVEVLCEVESQGLASNDHRDCISKSNYLGGMRGEAARTPDKGGGGGSSEKFKPYQRKIYK